MDYVQVVNLVFTILGGICSLLVVHFAVFAIVGIFAKKKYPKTEEKAKYGIIIPARNEEKVVGGLIESVYKNKYPQDKLQVFVIAHNCTDRTAEIAKSLGATVYEYNNPAECTMGYAFRYLFDRIREDWGVENYDGFFLFNADNVLDENYFDKMNDAFVANGKKNIITSFRNSKNFGTNMMTCLYGLYFMQGCRFEARGRTVTGCSTRVQGTGYVIPSETVKDGWKYVTLTEDWEFSADQVINDNKIYYCDEAVFYDEQPTDLKIMFRQRLRWQKGHLLVCVTRFKDMIKALFTPHSKGGCRYKGSAYDMTVNIMPVMVISTIFFLLKPIALAFAPLFGADPATVWLDWGYDTLWAAAGYYAAIFLSGLFLLILEHKRIKHVKWWLKIDSLLIWPIFLLLSAPFEFISLFMKVGWKEIPHKDTTDHEKLN